MNVLETSTAFLARHQLNLEQRNEMFDLLAGCFDGVTRPQFERDLAEKNWVILVRRDDRLAGFSTVLACESWFMNRPVSVICSGDTIMAREAWGSPALARAWIAGVREIRTHFPRGKFYWLLLTSGFRTYRFLPVFWRDFFPRRGRVITDDEMALMNHLAVERFGPQFDSTTGIVRFKQPQRLRGELAEIPRGRATDPDVVFFLERNPGHQNGDELVCLTELSDANLTAAGRRMVRD